MNQTTTDPGDYTRLTTATDSVDNTRVTPDPVDNARPAPTETKTSRGWRFWLIFVCLALTAFLSALEGSIVSTALPSIARALNASEDYIWVVNVYYLTSAAVQPIYGQLADLWGRRWLMIGAVALFTLGSGICGGSTSTNMLIGGRTVQGLGAAGINMLIELILCDLLPLRERGQFFGALFLFLILGSALGPFLGGILVDRVSWRWAFYINLPFGGASLVLLYFVLHVRHKPQGGVVDKLKKIDLFGNLLLAASVSSVLYALTYGGTRYNWSNAGIITSLVLGLVGHVLFLLFEASPLCRDPVMPLSLFKHRTSTAAFIATFLQTIVSFWALFFLPLYFQSVKLVAPTRSGVLILPFTIIYSISGLIGGGLATKLGRFRIIHFAGFVLITIGIGTFTLFERDTYLAEIEVLQVVFAFGIGIVAPSLLTAIQAALPDDLNAASTGTFAFVRSIGTIWGVSIPAAIFNNRFDELLVELPDETARAALARGHAYESASAAFVNSFPGPIRDMIVSIYERSLMRVWQIGIVFAGLGFLVVFLERDLELRAEQESQGFGLEERQRVNGETAFQNPSVP